jgi:RNA-directed DNA polymerase
MRKRGTSKHYVYTVPSKKAIQAVKDKISAKTDRSTLAGWENYFRHGVSEAVFSAIDSQACGRIMRWLRQKHSRLGMPALRRRFCAAPGGSPPTGSSSLARPPCR